MKDDVITCPSCKRKLLRSLEVCPACQAGLTRNSRGKEPCLQYLDDSLKDFFEALKIFTGIILFVGIWIYAFTQWGFLVGLAIGWLPAIVGAFIGGYIWAIIYYFIFT